MKPITTFLVCFLASLHSFGQYETAWGKQMASTDIVRMKETILDNSGNLYTVGFFKGTADMDPGPGVYSVTATSVTGDLYIHKTDVNGNFLWVKTVPVNQMTSQLGIALDGTGNVYVTGSLYTAATVDFDPGPSVYSVTRQSNNADAYILKLDSNGDFVWVKMLTTTPSSLQYGVMGHDIDVDDSGNILLIGASSPTVDFDPGSGVFTFSSDLEYLTGYIAKYTSNGNFIAAKEIYDCSASRHVTHDASGNIFVSGFFNSTIDCDPSAATYTMTPVGGFDGFLIKFTSAVNFAWARQIAGPNTDDVNNVYVESSGDIIFTGSFTGTVDFNPGAGVHNMTASGTSEMYVCKYTAAGNFVWAKQSHSAVSAQGSYTASDASGSIFTVGTYTGLTNFGITPADTLNSFTTGKSCAFVTKRDTSGNLLYAARIGGTAQTYASHLNLYAIPDQLLIAGGFSNGTIDVDVEAGVTNFSTPGTSNNVFLVKLQPECIPSAGSLNASHCSSYTVPSGHETYTVSGTYTDTIPNESGCDSVITISLTIGDGIAPVANTANLADVSAQCSVTNLIAPTATDNCVGTITGTHSITLPITTQGTTIVTWTYDDGNGNTSTQTQNVVINDNTAPVANAANLSNVTGQCSVTTLTAPTATDNCAGAITGTHNATLPITTPGTTVLTWTYNDGNGNTSTQMQNVIVALPVATTTLSGITISATTSGATYQWVNCGNGNAPIAGATAQSFTATANGMYAVIVTQGGCSATSACVAISTVGLEENNQAIFAVYPNPNAGTFKVVSGTTLVIRITNTAGQVVLTQALEAGENTIELTHVESGVYFISSTDENGQVSTQRLSIIK